jgi:alpha-beta hydrolase superfamily lysophospholipase
MERCLSRAAELKVPLLVFHGGEDRLTDRKGSETLFARASTPAAKKELHIFPGLYHETMNEAEKEREKVLRVVYCWITGAARGRKASAAKGHRKTKKQRRGNPRREK